MRKKCLMLIPRLGSGGAERVMVTLANRLCNDWDIEIVTLMSPECFYSLDGRVPVIGLNSSINRKNKWSALLSQLWHGPKCLLKIRKIIREKRPDAVLSFLVHTNALILLIKALWRPDCRIVVSERNDPSRRSRISCWFERAFYPKADAIVCQSKNAAAFFPQKAQAKIHVIANPVCADCIPPLYTGARKKKIVAVGRLFPQKNFPLLIDAFSNLHPEFPDYTLEIYGGGYLEDSLREQIRSLGLERHASLMGVRKNVMFDIADAQLFVMSSDFEGFPNALVEAMATGLPVISTDFATGVAREIIGEKNGIVVPTGDAAALSAAIRELLSDEGRMEIMRHENRKILDILSEERIVEKWKAVLSR